MVVSYFEANKQKKRFLTDLNLGCELIASCGKKSECEAPDVVEGL
jgi:hypothetical protein